LDDDGAPEPVEEGDRQAGARERQQLEHALTREGVSDQPLTRRQVARPELYGQQSEYPADRAGEDAPRPTEDRYRHQADHAGVLSEVLAQPREGEEVAGPDDQW